MRTMWYVQSPVINNTLNCMAQEMSICYYYLILHFTNTFRLVCVLFLEIYDFIFQVVIKELGYYQAYRRYVGKYLITQSLNTYITKNYIHKLKRSALFKVGVTTFYSVLIFKKILHLYQ